MQTAKTSNFAFPSPAPIARTDSSRPNEKSAEFTKELQKHNQGAKPLVTPSDSEKNQSRPSQSPNSSVRRPVDRQNHILQSPSAEGDSPSTQENSEPLNESISDKATQKLTALHDGLEHRLSDPNWQAPLEGRLPPANLERSTTSGGDSEVNDDALDSSPALLLLSGKSSPLISETMTKISASNPFIKEALAQSMEKVMGEEKTVIQHLQDFEIPVEEGVKALQNKFQPQDIVTAKDFLKGLGVDPHRVAAEFQNLEYHLNKLNVLKPSASTLAELLPAGVNRDKLLATPQEGTIQKPIFKPAKDNPVVAPHLQAPEPRNLDNPAPAPLAAQLLTIQPDSSPALNPTTRTSPPPLTAKTDEVPPQIKQLLTETNEHPATVKADPYDSLKINKTSISKSEPNAQSKLPYPNLGQTPPIQTPKIDWARAQVERNEGTSAIPEETLLITQPSLNQQSAKNMNTVESISSSIDGTNAGIDPKLALNTDSGFQEDSRSQQDSTKDQLPERTTEKRNVSQSGGSALNSPTSFLETLSHEGEPLSETGQLPQDRIIDRAKVLIKDGGGSVRLDMADPKLGSLTVAVQLEDSKIKLKIMSSSEKVQDLLGLDVPLLQEALQVKNMSLVEVQIGDGDLQQNLQQEHQSHQQRQEELDRDFWKELFPGADTLEAQGHQAKRGLLEKASRLASASIHTGMIQVGV